MNRTVEFFVAIGVEILLLFIVYQEPKPTLAPPPCYVPIEVLSVHDGDTLKANIVLPFGSVVLREQNIRLQGFDAWEINRIRQTVVITEEELHKGREAKAALIKLLTATGTRVYAQPSDDKGAYGRVSAVLAVQQADGKLVDVASWMKERGHGRDERQSILQPNQGPPGQQLAPLGFAGGDGWRADLARPHDE